MGDHKISIEQIYSRSSGDDNVDVIYEEKIDEGNLEHILNEFVNEVDTSVNDCNKKIEYIDGELEKTNSNAFYHGSEASKQRNKLTTASQDFEELKRNRLYSDISSIIEAVKLYNNMLCSQKWVVRINLCNKKIEEINGKPPVNISIENPRKQGDLSMNYPCKKEVVVDEIYKDTYVPLVNEVLDDGHYRITWTITRTVCIEETANKNNVIDLEAKIKKTGAELLYDESKAVWYD